MIEAVQAVISIKRSTPKESIEKQWMLEYCIGLYSIGYRESILSVN